jgi:type I restriction enzyme S subunit
VPLAEIATINPPGGTFSAEDDELVSFVPMPAVRELCGQMDTSDARPYFEVKKGYTRFVEGDVLFAKITPCMENGKIAVARGLINGKGCGSTEFHVLRADAGILPDWLRYFIVQDAFRGEAQRHMSGAVGQLRVPTDFLRQAHIPLPTTAEQSRIISKIEELFSDLDKGEENLRRAQAQLKRYRQSVLKAAVTGELTRSWRERNADTLESGEALLKRILKARRAAWEKAELEKLRAKGKPPKDDAWKSRYVEPQGPNTEGLPELPEGWAWATFVQIGEFGRGKSKHRPRNAPKLYGGAYPFLQTGTVRASNGRIRSYDSTYNEAGLAQSKLWPEGTICITIAANIAESGILDFPACFPDSIVGLVPSEGVITEFIEFFIRTAREKLDTYAPATAQKNINLEILEKVGIPLPPTAEQNEIFSQAWERLSSIDAVEGELARQFAAVNALRQSILKAAFSGKLVPQDPNDEPAEELLKRISAERAAQGAGASKRAAARPAKAVGRKGRVARQAAPAAPTALASAAQATAPGLAAARKAAGLSQAQLAERAGINQAYVSQMETGKRAITADQAAALATALGLIPETLR